MNELIELYSNLSLSDRWIFLESILGSDGAAQIDGYWVKNYPTEANE